MTATETDTLEGRAREALALLAQRHDLPAPTDVFWREDLDQIHAMHASDADVDLWAQAMLRTAKAENVGPSYRTYGFRVPRWMGAGVGLLVSHDEMFIDGQGPASVAAALFANVAELVGATVPLLAWAKDMLVATPGPLGDRNEAVRARLLEAVDEALRAAEDVKRIPAQVDRDRA